MHLQIPHKFTQAQAVDRVKKGLVEAAPKLQGQVVIEKQEWDSNSLNFAFTAQGQKITGVLQVLEHEFLVDAKLPLIWRLFEGKIEKTIQEQVRGML